MKSTKQNSLSDHLYLFDTEKKYENINTVKNINYPEKVRVNPHAKKTYQNFN